MLRMRRITQILSAAAIATFAASQAQAGVTLQFNVNPNIGTSANATALENAGWVAVQVVAVADAASGNVLSFDFRTTTAGLPAGTPGIYGTFFQRYVYDENFDAFLPNVPSSANGGLPTAANASPDSFWINFDTVLGSAGYAPGDPLVDFLHYNTPNSSASDPGVDNTNLNAAVPLTDSPEPYVNQSSSNWGLGSELHGAGAFKLPAQTPSRVLAYLIVQNGSTINAVGQLVGANDSSVRNLINVSQVITVGDVPEPASLGVLALGGLALIARRRRA